MIEATLPFPRQQDLLALFGAKDQHLRLLRDQLRVNVTHGDGALVVRGDEDNVHKATDILEQLKDCLLYTSPSPRDLSTSRMPSSA